MTLEELRAKAAADIQTAAAKVAEQVEVISLTAAINRANNPALQTAVANAQIVASTTNRLKEIETSCEAIIASMPVYNSKTRENRKWTPRREYGLGLHIQLLSGILSGIQYSTVTHKQQLLTLLPGISEDLIESTLEAFGSTSYYSVNYNMIIPEIPANLDRLLNNLQIIEQALGINIDKDKLTSSVLATRFEVARLRALKDQADEEASLALQAQKVVI